MTTRQDRVFNPAEEKRETSRMLGRERQKLRRLGMRDDGSGASRKPGSAFRGKGEGRLRSRRNDAGESRREFPRGTGRLDLGGGVGRGRHRRLGACRAEPYASGPVAGGGGFGTRSDLLEKPACIDEAQLAQVEALDSRYPFPVWVAMEYRYMPPIAALIGEIRHGETLGNLVSVSIREHRFPFLRKVNDWNRFNRYTGAPWWRNVAIFSI